ncbi:MAG: methyltransferase domain-containing protein [Thermosynechococcaceae cyanobacterium MS004]|nr:methyltransferase domain-containing protein [Thermosynechococcaceae cyanobacterium MS004]
MKILSVRFPTFLQRFLLLGIGCLGLLGMAHAPSALALIADSSVYSYRRPSFDGIGKQYMGREIAEVMGHQGASWLERSDRTTEEQPQKMLAALHLAPTDTVAEIGAGTGYISLQAAALVPQGQVLAVDIQPEMIELLNSRIKSLRISNMTPILGTEQSPNLSPGSIDLALMVDAYHEFNFPREMMAAIAQALKPMGRVALVEYRGEDPFVFIKPHHKMTQAQVRQEMEAVGLTWQETQALPQQHLMIFAKG